MNNNKLRFDITRLAGETDRAVAVRLKDGSRLWIPRSVTDVQQGPRATTLLVEAWWVHKYPEINDLAT